MQIMCLNSWGGTLHDQLLPYLTETQPDVLCLQEVVHSPASHKQMLTYRDGDHVLTQRANLFSDVCAALPQHSAVFCPAARGSLWDQDTEVPSFWGLATFVHKSSPVIGQTSGFVHGAYGAHGFGPHPRSRSAHAVRVYDHTRDLAMTIAHMHGLRDLGGKHDTPARLQQAHKLVQLTRSLAQPNDDIVVCGDFNVTPNSETLNVLGGLGLTELVTERGHPTTRTSHYKKPGRFADYMMVSASLRSADFHVVTQPEVSDHCPLVLTV